MSIYDFHAHIYPAKIAEKATASVGNFYNIKMNETGTVERLLQLGDEAGIDKFIVHSVATGARQVQSVNDFMDCDALLVDAVEECNAQIRPVNRPHNPRQTSSASNVNDTAIFGKKLKRRQTVHDLKRIYLVSTACPCEPCSGA